MYRIIIEKHALNELEQLPKKDNRKLLAIDNLVEDPRPNGCKKLKGEHEYIWCIRIGNYRVLYSIDDEIKIVEIGKIRHRKNIYG